jgi:hypothetical protein
MKKFLLTFLFSLAIMTTQAQYLLDQIGTSPSVAFSLRLLKSTYTGPLVRIYVGTSYYDVYPDATTKNFSLSSKISAAIGSSSAAVAVASTNALSTIITVGTTNATVAIWYDQSGNNKYVHTSNTTAAPRIITAGSIRLMNGQPTINFIGAQTSPTPSALISVNTVNYSSQQTATVNAVVQNIGSTSVISGIYSTGKVGGWGLNYDQTNGYWLDGSGCNHATTGAPSTTAKIVTGFLNKSNSTSIIYENSVQKGSMTIRAGCPPTNGTSDKIAIGIRAEDGGNRKFDGNISEVILYPAILSATDQATLESSQNAAYFVPSVTIASSASGAVCAGTSVTFTATTYNFTGTPTYQWYKNGAVISGETNATYTTSTLANADQIYVIASAVTSNSLNANITAGPSAVVSVSGDGCINKTTLSTPTGFSYTWYKDNAPIAGATSNTYSPTTAGDYKVQVTSGSCSTMSAATTIAVCGVTADGRMRSIATPTTLVSQEGGVNFGTGVSEAGATVNATEIGTTLGTVGATTAVVSGVISSTNARTTSIGVIYSTDSNFGTYSTSSTQSNVAAGTHAISLSGLTASTTYHAKAFITNKAGTSYGPAVSFTTTTPPIEVGNSYGGGLVFYIFQSGDPGYVAGETHGLIASSSDLSTYTDWKNNGGFTDIATGTGIGTGLANTNAIISSHGSSATYAAGFARAYNGGGYTDWYLPSRDELYKMHISIGQGANNIANMRSETYWSSSQSDSYQAYYMFAQNGNITTIWKDWGKAVRAIRTF